MIKRRQEAMLETRNSLVQAARVRFAQDGYEAASLLDIARDAGATTGAIYHHFGSKAELFEVVAKGIESQIMAELVAASDLALDPAAQLIAAVKQSLAILTKPENVQIVLIDAPSVIGFAEWREIETGYSLGAIVGLLRSVALPGTDPELDARLIIALVIEAALYLARSNCEPVMAMRQAEQRIETTIRSILAK